MLYLLQTQHQIYFENYCYFECVGLPCRGEDGKMREGGYEKAVACVDEAIALTSFCGEYNHAFHIAIKCFNASI